MTTAFDAPLNEALRDAMLALYLHEAVPSDPYLIEQKLVDQIKTGDDLYEYWLLDVLVSQNVPTSPVACAIASLQQLVNSMMLNMEPGYSDDSLTPQQTKTWRDGLNRYPIWAAIQQLHHFPDIYLDPTLRLTKTDSFKQLENDINQAQIQPDTVQTAVLAYLGRFEEIANLKVCNGYIDGEDFANSTYYFIGKSPAENAYYWRSLDMSQRPVRRPAKRAGDTPDKFDKPLPNAWSDWKRANVPISEKALEHTIRPCWFNNRLFVTWAEVEYQDSDAIAPTPENKADLSVKVHPRFRLYASYKKYDDSWSTPRVYIESYCQTPALVAKTREQIESETQTIAVYDHSTSPESMVLMLYSNYQPDSSDEPDTSGDNDKYDFLRTVRIDKNFHVTSLFPSLGVVPNVKPATVDLEPRDNEPSKAHVLFIGYIFANANKNAGRFQYWLPTGTKVFGAMTPFLPDNEKDTWDFGDRQSWIKTSSKDVELVYDRSNSKIQLTVKLNRGFPDNTSLTFTVTDKQNAPIIKVTLVFSSSFTAAWPWPWGWVPLLEGSCIEPIDTDFMDQQDAAFCFNGKPDLIRSLVVDYGSNNPTNFSVPATKKGGSASLVGKNASSIMLRLLLENPESLSLTDFWCSRSANLPLAAPIFFSSVKPVGYQFFVGHPTDVASLTAPLKFEEMQSLYPAYNSKSLSTDDTAYYEFSIDQTTHRPEGWQVTWPDDVVIPLIYGVLIREEQTSFTPSFATVRRNVTGGALKMLTIGWGQALNTDPKVAPSINSLVKPSLGDSPSLGKAQFIDFMGSSIEFSDGQKPITASRAPIRMNTTFARHLIELAESGIEPLLSWETQTQRTEPPIPNGIGAEPMDFSGAYYLYFLELFLYLPWLVAYRLNEEQQYDQARHWLSFIFDPARQSVDPGHPGYWQAVPLMEPVWPGPVDPSQAILYPDDPHQIGLSFPVHFRKALYGLYIDIESNQADQAYGELTPDGLAEAKLRYVHILDLLGRRPDVRQVDDWAPISLETLSDTRNEELRGFEQQLIAHQRDLQEHPPLRIGKAPGSEIAPLLCLRPFANDSSLSSTDNPYLRRPFNPELIQRWERAESRLYNLRHNLDMAGNALNLPLFAAPLDPRALLAAWGQGLSGAALSRLLNPQIPHYRFSFMFALAQNAVDNVIQFGATLLSLIERKEQAQYLELQQQQAWNLAKVAVDIQVQAGKIDEANRKALLASQAIVKGRVSYYEALLKEGTSPTEVAALGLALTSRVLDSVAQSQWAAGETLKTAPNIIGAFLVVGAMGGAAGFIAGGQRAEGASNSAATMAFGGSALASAVSQGLERTEQYRRRNQEWTQARDQSKLEAEQIKAQLEVFEAQHIATQLQLRQAQTALNQAKATHDFLLSSNRFSKSQTYDWLNSKFASFYYTAYNTAQSLCQMAEACWQYEMGDFTKTFIRPGAWNSTYRGLGAGEELKMSLQQMYAEYLKNNKRDLEIRKTVSLKGLRDKDSTSKINKTWADIKTDLKNGSCKFELTQKMFDDDYESQNHYLRRIKTISVTLPVTVGPYEDICAVLQQDSSKVEMAATKGTLKENLRASQQIALSHGVDDNGQFQLNFQDERYLPFEYTGAISSWTLTFPNHDAQSAMLDRLNDIIVHVSYTARREGGLL
ncbi:neuraminidase-like domain-containing protein [Pseudomonas sp. Sample_10]|uniref:Tc toxin subunit A-related protein n=1 Tax=Pseudomonas sp. Sample_10 TaxID=2448269 RepID=UPI00103655B1|nr:neuraminidase-like domain-containing protein [Pseudomonas sp. Sample_10]